MSLSLNAQNVTEVCSSTSSSSYDKFKVQVGYHTEMGPGEGKGSLWCKIDKIAVSPASGASYMFRGQAYTPGDIGLASWSYASEANPVTATVDIIYKGSLIKSNRMSIVYNTEIKILTFYDNGGKPSATVGSFNIPYSGFSKNDIVVSIHDLSSNCHCGSAEVQKLINDKLNSNTSGTTNSSTQYSISSNQNSSQSDGGYSSNQGSSTAKKDLSDMYYFSKEPSPTTNQTSNEAWGALNSFGNSLVNNIARNQEAAYEAEMRRAAAEDKKNAEEYELWQLKESCLSDFEKGNYDKIYNNALKGLSNKNKKYETDFLFWAVIGGVLQKKFEEGISYANKLKKHPKFSEVGNDNLLLIEFYSGISHHNLKKYDDAIVAYKNALKINDKISSINRIVGDVYFEMKNYNDAIVYYTKELEITPYDLSALKSRAETKLKLKDFQGAESDYTLGIDHTSESVFFYEKRAENRHFNLMNYDGAIADYTKLMEIGSKKASYFHKRAKVYLSKKETDLALNDINTAIALDPKDSWFYFFRSHIYMRKEKNDLNKALSDLNIAVELNPASFDILHRRATVFKRQKNYTRAALDYTSLVQKKSDSEFYNFELAKLYSLYLNDTASANPYFRKVLTLSKIETRITFCHLFLGNTELAQSRIEQAIQSQTDIKEKRQLMYYQAEMYAILKQEKKALTILEELLKTGYVLDPYEAQFADGFIYIKDKPAFKNLLVKYYKPQ
ncbi:MAG: hypothetical protein JNL24_06695 [Bacteroidia bacterium]|nr:hypothetical protein [Bacteroidia bacterium]